MDAQFTYGDIVRVSAGAPSTMRPGERAWVIAVLVGANVPTYREFLPEPVYSVEFEDGSAQDIEEALLEPSGE